MRICQFELLQDFRCFVATASSVVRWIYRVHDDEYLLTLLAQGIERPSFDTITALTLIPNNSKLQRTKNSLFSISNSIPQPFQPRFQTRIEIKFNQDSSLSLSVSVSVSVGVSNIRLSYCIVLTSSSMC